MGTEVDAAPETLFRPAKRRKFMRRRPDDNADEYRVASEAAPTSPESNQRVQAQSNLNKKETEEEPVSTASFARLRRPHTVRKGGIGFSATSRSSKDDSRQRELAPATDVEKEKIQAMCDRFTAYTGQTVDVDKHMYGPPVSDTQSVRYGLTR